MSRTHGHRDRKRKHHFAQWKLMPAPDNPKCRDFNLRFDYEHNDPEPGADWIDDLCWAA